MSYGPEGEAFFCDVCEDDPTRCTQWGCPGRDDPHTQPSVAEMISTDNAISGRIRSRKEQPVNTPSSPSTQDQDADLIEEIKARDQAYQYLINGDSTGTLTTNDAHDASIDRATLLRLLKSLTVDRDRFRSERDGWIEAYRKVNAEADFILKRAQRAEEALKSRQPHVTLTEAECKEVGEISAGLTYKDAGIWTALRLLKIIDRLCLTKADDFRDDIAAELERLYLNGWRFDTKEGRAPIVHHVEDMK